MGFDLSHGPDVVKVEDKSLVRGLFRPLLLLFVAVVGAGCYMPIRFDAEIELTRSGYYEFFFDGYLAKVQLYDKLRKREISREEEKEQVELIKNDFKRDRSTKEFKYYKKGHFRVNWERKGDLTKAKSVTFFRRNEHMLGIAYNSKSGRVSISGRSIKRDTKRQLDEIGLGTTGQIRVITDANVISHNATSVKKFRRRGPRFKIYTWEIKSLFDRTPSMTVALR